MRFAALLIALFLIPPSAYALLSPVWEANAVFKAALAGDTCFVVLDPATVGNIEKVVIQTCSDDRAQAWEAIISPSFQKNYAYVEFQGPSGPAQAMPISGSSNADQIASLSKILNLALSANPAFDSVVSTDTEVILVMKPQVIRVYVDDLSDPWGQQNKTAEDHFAALISLQYGNLKAVVATTKLPSPN